MEELEETIKEEILQDITVSDIRFFKKQMVSKKDFKGTVLFTKLWEAFDREIHWREQEAINEMKRILEAGEGDSVKTHMLMDDTFALQRLDDIRCGQKDMINDICLELLS